MKKILHPEPSRGTANYGWLQAKYSFSFAQFFDKDRLQFGKIRVLNDDVIAPAMGFSKHPHRNMEIITIPQQGALRHRDSMGNEGVIRSGDIQLMSAGSGVEHSEMNASSTAPVRLFQIWLLPDTENASPRYDQKTVAPLLRENQLTTIIKPKQEAATDELWLHQQAYFSLGDFDVEKTFAFQLKKETHGAYFFIIEGNATIASEALERRDAIGIWETPEVTVAVAPSTRLLVIETPMN
ncbi:MAG: pirin family protein [Marinirhabdus sp.]